MGCLSAPERFNEIAEEAAYGFPRAGVRVTTKECRTWIFDASLLFLCQIGLSGKRGGREQLLN